MWYFSENNERQGPVGLEEMEDLVMQGRVIRGTLVWQKGMAEWQPIETTEFKDVIDKHYPPPLPTVKASSTYRTTADFEQSTEIESYSGNSYELSPREQIQQLKTWFKVFWLSLAIGIPLTVLIIGIGGIITSIVFGYMILFKSWKIIQDGRPRTTPGRAVGFMFIPFFNLYWQFIAYLGLAKDLNRYMRNRKIRSAFINEDLVLWYCITTCTAALLAWIPFLGILVILASFVLWILTMNTFKNASIAILKSKSSS